MVYRTSDKSYTAAVDRWFGKVLPMLVPHLYRNGGPIFAVQVENEYGHYGKCDLPYMEHLLNVMESFLGKDLVYIRTDFPNATLYACDKVRDVVVAGNLVSDYSVESSIKTMKQANPKPAPSVIMEFYTGWMDYWGYSPSFVKKSKILNTYKSLMTYNASVTFYMFIGGTKLRFQIGYLGHVPEGEMPTNTTKLKIGTVQLNDYISLEDMMEHFRKKGWLQQKKSVDPLTFEQMNHDYGFLMYRTTVNVVTWGTAQLWFPYLRDRAYVRAGGKLFSFYNYNGQRPADTFLDPRGWIKGFAFINGFNLGRYWPVSGPQVTLYLPGVYLRPHPEENQLLLFETEEAPTNRTVMLVDKPILDADIPRPRP
ncbi:hypothetical protein MTO96_045264 [Rhipicephalus appendiculatus]